MRANKLPVPTEAQEQITLMNWAELAAKTIMQYLGGENHG